MFHHFYFVMKIFGFVPLSPKNKKKSSYLCILLIALHVLIFPVRLHCIMRLGKIYQPIFTGFYCFECFVQTTATIFTIIIAATKINSWIYIMKSLKIDRQSKKTFGLDVAIIIILHLFYLIMWVLEGAEFKEFDLSIVNWFYGHCCNYINFLLQYLIVKLAESLIKKYDETHTALIAIKRRLPINLDLPIRTDQKIFQFRMYVSMQYKLTTHFNDLFGWSMLFSVLQYMIMFLRSVCFLVYAENTVILYDFTTCLQLVLSMVRCIEIVNI